MKYIVHCKTQDEWDEVVRTLKDNIKEKWNTHKYETCIDITDGKYYYSMDRLFYNTYNTFKDYTFLTAKEYLDIVRIEKQCGKNNLDAETEIDIYLNGGKRILEYLKQKHLDEYMSRYNDEELKSFISSKNVSNVAEIMMNVQNARWELEEQIDEDGITTSATFINNKPKLMTQITKFAKDLTLSKDEKELRKAGLQDDDGNWTQDAICLVLDMVANGNGFGNRYDMEKKYGGENFGYTTLELHNFFDKHYDELLEIAKKYNKDNK